jgi:hypothetical protein
MVMLVPPDYSITQLDYGFCISSVLPNAGVTVGLSSGGGILFLAAAFAVLTRRWKRSAQKRLRKKHFRKNKGILLEQLISSDENASDGTKIFSLEELEKATNKFDHARVVGRGGHGYQEIKARGKHRDRAVHQ